MFDCLGATGDTCTNDLSLKVAQKRADLKMATYRQGLVQQHDSRVLACRRFSANSFEQPAFFRFLHFAIDILETGKVDHLDQLGLTSDFAAVNEAAVMRVEPNQRIRF